MDVRARSLDGTIATRSVTHGRWGEPDGSELLDVSSLWSVRGLADAHVHLSADTLDLAPAVSSDVESRAFAALAGGVFLCLDKGWSDDLVLRLSASPEFPEVQAAGRMVATPGGYYPGFAEEVDPAGLTRAIERRVGDRRWVKLVGDWPRKGEGVRANFDEESLAAAVAVAHSAGCKVALHTMGVDVPGPAVRAGIDSIEHGLYLTEEDLSILGARDGMWVPTVRRTQQLAEAMAPGSNGARVLGEGLANLRRTLPRAHDLGVVVLAGSDLAMAPEKIGDEVVGLVEMHCPPRVAVDAACADTIRRHDGLWSDDWAGAPADLVSFARDPVEEPSTMMSPVLVIHHGRIVADRRP